MRKSKVAWLQSLLHFKEIRIIQAFFQRVSKNQVRLRKFRPIFLYPDYIFINANLPYTVPPACHVLIIIAVHICT